MAQRVFGPVRGAGTQIVELEGDKPIEPGALGPIGYAGLFEKGDPGELIFAPNKKRFLKKLGGYIEDGQAPDAAIDFYDVAAGAGAGWFVRVTDGNEVKAEASLYARRTQLTQMGTLRAKNGGRWAGKKDNHTAEASLPGDLAETTLDTGVATWGVDQWKGGWLSFEDIANTLYPIIGNTAAGIVTVALDSTMLTDYGAGSSGRYSMYLKNEGKELTYRIRDGEDTPASEWALDLFVDGALVLQYPNLHVDPTSSRYWVDLINDDDGNDEIEAVDLWTGAYTADVRPANHYGEIDTVTTTVLTALISNFTINSPGAGDPTFALGTTTDDGLAQRITITMTSPTEGTAVSDKFGALGTVTLGTLFDPVNGAGGANTIPWAPPFTVTAGGTALVATDTLVINYKPFIPDSLINGLVYPDKGNEMREKYRIVDNDHKSITAADGSDLTASGAPADEWLVETPLAMAGGVDGNNVVDADYNQQAWDTGTSPFNRLRDRGQGLVKFATPGITASAVQKGGVAYAAAKNHQYRYEIPSTTVTEDGADAYVNDTLGRSDYAVVAFPSYGYVPDPEAAPENKLKLVTLTGQIHGREAAIARDWKGYHKAEAGEDAVLPKVTKLPTGEAQLDEETLNPRGINVIKKKKGNFVIWGDRTLWTDPSWKWKHQRELMSYYEQVLIESFDWIVFTINDPITDTDGLVALKSFFLPEWTKRALRGATFEIAAIIKLDGELNTDAVRAAGDKVAEIKLKLADTTERFVIRVGKQGIFESVQ